MRWLLSLLFVLTSVVAFAQSDADAEKARDCYERGQRHYDLGNYDRAIEEFKKGYLLSGLSPFLLNIGQAYRQKGDTANALDYYKRFLAKAEPDDPARPGAEKIIAELEAGDPKARVGPTYDSGLTQDEIKTTLGTDYPNYISSGLTYEGYSEQKEGQKMSKIGLGVMAGGLVVGGALLLLAKAQASAPDAGPGAGTGATTGALVVGLGGFYLGYAFLNKGSKQVASAKTKKRSAQKF